MLLLKYYVFIMVGSFILIMMPDNKTMAQNGILIDHTSTDLNAIPDEWIFTAKADLNIAYGHTSHGSQLISGMESLQNYFPEGKYDFSNQQTEGQLLLKEGSGYGDGYMELDCGYDGWDSETREYLEAFPDCNVIIWSWCGQVNSVDLLNHYFKPMEKLETDYPYVRFVYMTGHLEGLGPEGSVYAANQLIRDYCMANNKILYDFADIEKYDPDQEVNYQEYFVDDACDYLNNEGGISNWASEWLGANPEHLLFRLAANCNYCAHSEALNCVQKGIASWHLWARLAGWDGTLLPSQEVNQEKVYRIFPNPVSQYIHISGLKPQSSISIIGLEGKKLESVESVNEIQLDIDVSNLPVALYILEIVTSDGLKNQDLFMKY